MSDLVKVTLPDGSQKEAPRGTPVIDFVKGQIGPGLAKAAYFARLDGEPVDLSRAIERDARLEIVTTRNPEALEVARHDAAHVMASVVQKLYPGTQVTIGPAIEDGFYYDFARETPFTPEDLERIEKATNEAIKADLPFVRSEISMEAALALFEGMGERYKVEIVKDIAAKGAKTLTLYKHGDWVDFCLGPHGPSTGRIGVVKLLNVAGAYWRGDAKNAMLQRIYGTAFFDKKELDAHLAKLEEVKKRDHRRLGPQLGLFTFHEFAPGAPFWLPAGTVLYNVLEDAMRRLVLKNGYQEVKTPLLFNKRLWETSGHWGKYRENMFLVVDSESDPALPLEDRCSFSLKPMNCPSHHLIYRMDKRSYRELPVRYFTTDALHRNEASGSLGGLTRVRQFEQDDAHIYLREEQVTDEVLRIFELMKVVYGAFGLGFEATFSTRPEQRIGDDALWDRAEALLRKSLDATGLKWTLNAGDGAFYGPKIDMLVTDSLGRKWQTCTIQLDYAAPERFDLTFVGEDNKEHRPVVIHRAIYGSFERFVAILVEHYAGAFPAWLAPVQARVVTVSDRFEAWAREAGEALQARGWRVEVDASSDKLGAKIRNAQLAKIPFTLVVGEKEVEAKGVSPRRHGGEDLKTMPLETFAELMAREATAPF
ncbi:threonyl-tRNA synthetase [Anaeromyxobacter dehalogenans 2CP-1]|uniref:Threonine--tRNA ligase n=1 Tax=Anaeromyxobacter dehalogenans (strain ATCC BAA-258 / DSM 21875 / 2CP-1) TaxID=455488 RepID=SYT_ANAD2|nr:threonine--tRNA ligase [Anaeromyxobacter dehalogenans]B8J823.1 RecName: Full=Threonine--tRNA ligase; AltName: Full=Threonyl-tRNA synthetase; Short=ThrRS [Anaeromyxobacter dehalogenans 2CP-1]ACL65322.1 threonyl-tRNA synthetase [Anaeromyxobacter dehalogenans 2CP-1]